MKRAKKNSIKELAQELDILDEMLSALVELLEERGIVTHDEWEKKIAIRLTKVGGTKQYRDIQFPE